MEAYSWFNRRCHYRNSIVAFFNKPIFIAKEIAIRQWWMAIFMIIYLFFEISAMVFALNSTSHRYHFTVNNRLNTVLCFCTNHNITTRINCHHLIINHEFKGTFFNDEKFFHRFMHINFNLFPCLQTGHGNLSDVTRSFIICAQYFLFQHHVMSQHHLLYLCFWV